MNIYVEKISTAEEAVALLKEKRILNNKREIDCEKLAEEIRNIVKGEHLPEKEKKFLSSLSAEEKNNKISNLKSQGLIPWQKTIKWLPRWPFTVKAFREAIEASL